MSARISRYWTKRRALTEVYGDLCFYCREEIATTLDHVIPYSYVDNDDTSNLRPACALCNLLANDKMFESAEDKRNYLLGIRKRRHALTLRQCSCTECGIPYIFREHSPSIVLCAECYDLEYQTDACSGTRTWRRWLRLLEEAQMFVEIYRTAGQINRKTRCGVSLALIEATRLVESREFSAELPTRHPTHAKEAV